MADPISFVVSVWMKILFIFTPFLVMSIFLGMTRDSSAAQRRILAIKATAAVGIICFSVFFFGQVIFSLFGITLDAFRIGAGALLFLSAVDLVQSKSASIPSGEDGFVVVPFAMPIVVGPAVMGILFVLSADAASPRERLLVALAIALAVGSLAILLLVSALVERIIGKKALAILSKTTGLILSALAAQMIFTGIGNILNLK